MHPSQFEKLTTKFLLDGFYPNEKETVFARTEDTKAVIARHEVPKQSPLTIPDSTIASTQKYFRVGEAAELLGVEPYVLRYWESEFKDIKPMKAKSGHRVYTINDMVLFEKIRHLLYVEKFSIKGARQRLSEVKNVEPTTTPSQKIDTKVLEDIVGDLKTLLSLLR